MKAKKRKKNSFADVKPLLAKEWHPTKNGDLKPSDVSPSSNIKVWWYLPYDDPETGKHFDFEWQEKVSDRNRYNGCPYLTGCAVWPGFNDLATANPELAKEWHPTKNGTLMPSHVRPNSEKKVWWYLPYDDPNTGKHFVFEWQALICNRYNKAGNCPYLLGRAVWPGFNDLETVNPELAKEWHPTKNGDLKPNDVYASSTQKVWWQLSYDDPNTGRHFDFEWCAKIKDRNYRGIGCPFLAGKEVWPGFRDLETVNPELAREWHPTKNGDLKPANVFANSSRIVWWYLPYDDPETGKHFDFEWQESIGNRNRLKYGCPYFSGNSVWPGFNDLATLTPELAKEWHPIKNGDLKPINVSANSGKKVWWYLPYDDPVTGRHFDFEWQTTVADRNTKKCGCPYLSGSSVWSGFNDLATVNPELAKEWHPTKNGKLTPADVYVNSTKKVWWYLPYDDPITGNHFDFEWKAKIGERNTMDRGCPFLVGQQVWPGYNDLATLNPKLAREWHPTRNGNLKPSEVTAYSKRIVWWYLPYDDPVTGNHFDFEWKASICSRNARKTSCPYLTGNAVWPGFNDLATVNPELANEWHPEKNRRIMANMVRANSCIKRWWLCQMGHEWRASPNSRFKGANCPKCWNNHHQK